MSLAVSLVNKSINKLNLNLFLDHTASVNSAATNINMKPQITRALRSVVCDY